MVDSQNRMLEGHKDQQEAEQRAQDALDAELAKATAVDENAGKPDPKAEEARLNKLKELEGIVAQFMKENQEKQTKITDLEKENIKMSKDFDVELKKVEAEFAQVTKEAKEEQKQMSITISLLEFEINKNGGAKPKQVVDPNAGNRKKEIEEMKK